jgi:uncharacterized membrane protein
MTTRTAPRRVILLLVTLTALCAAVAAASSVGAVDIVFGLPLALFLPGAALIWAIDPWGRAVKGPERLMWSCASSIGIVILGGLLLNLIGGLTRAHWLILISAVVAVAAVAAWLRSGSQVEEEHPDLTREGEKPARWATTITLRPVALLVAALLVVSGALVLSQRTNTESNREHFVQAWILPQPTGNVFSTTAQLGVRNEEGDTEVLLIRVKVGSSGTSTKTIELKDGQEWTRQVSRHPGQPVSATVAIASRPSSIVDRVNLAKPS